MGIELVMGLLSLTVLIACLFNPNVANRARLQEDRMYANMCAELVKRIGSLVPIYEEVTNRYAWVVTTTVVTDPTLNSVASQVPDDIKQKAERDFCVQDSMKIEAVSLLQMQLTSMINNNNKEAS